jgi:hypothetical protein
MMVDRHMLKATGIRTRAKIRNSARKSKNHIRQPPPFRMPACEAPLRI